MERQEVKPAGKAGRTDVFILTHEFRISAAWTDLGQRGDTAEFHAHAWV